MKAISQLINKGANPGKAPMKQTKIIEQCMLYTNAGNTIV
jgi:hypothetical protein